MKSRYLTAAIGIPLVLGVVWYGKIPFLIVVAILAFLALRELEIACRSANTPIVSVVAYPALLAILWFTWSFARQGDRSHADAPFIWILPVALLVVGVLAF